MITGFVLETLPVLLLRFRALVENSYSCGLIRRLCRWLRQLFCESWLGGILLGHDRSSSLFRLYGSVRRLCYESWMGGILARHDQEGRIYEDSLICRIFDSLIQKTVSGTRRLISLLTCNTYDSMVISWGKRLAAHARFLDFEFFCGGALFLMLVCPGQYWHNAYALLAGFLLLGALLIVIAVKNREPLSLKALGFPLLCFVFASAAGIGIAADKSEAVRVFCSFLAAFLFCIVLIGAASDKEKLKKLLCFIYLAMIVNALLAFYQRLTGVAVSSSLTDLSANAGMPGRVYASYENPNNYAEIIVLLLPVSLAYCTMIEEKGKRLAALLSLLLPVGALLMTYCRSGWVSFALAAVVFVFLYNKRLLPVFILLGIMAIPLLPQTVFNRILTIGSTKDSSNMYRLYIWDSVTDMIRNYGLIGLGLGPGNFRPVYLLYCHKIAQSASHSHMLYLELWIELGILGIGSYLCYYLTTIRNAIVQIAAASRPVRITLIACVSSLAGIAFISAAEYIWFYPRVMFSFFILTGITGATINIAKREHVI